MNSGVLQTARSRVIPHVHVTHTVQNVKKVMVLIN